MSALYFLTAPVYELLPSLRKVRRLAAVRLAKATNVLEIGCGIGGNARRLPGRYLGVDLDRRLLAQAKRRAPGKDFRQLDAAMLDAPDRGYDSILLTLTVHELRNREAVLHAATRLAAHRILIVDYAVDLPGRTRRRLAWFESPELADYWALDLPGFFHNRGWRLAVDGRISRLFHFWEFHRSDEPA